MASRNDLFDPLLYKLLVEQARDYALLLLDRDGRKLASTSQLGATPDPAFVEAVRAAVRGTQ